MAAPYLHFMLSRRQGQLLSWINALPCRTPPFSTLLAKLQARLAFLRQIFAVGRVKSVQKGVRADTETQL
jgi:hypothetical protein